MSEMELGSPDAQFWGVLILCGKGDDGDRTGKLQNSS